MITLRPYQEDALTAIWNYFVAGNTGNPCIAWPTGTGKSVLPAIFIERIMKIYPMQRFMLITHVKELIEQNAEVLRLVWPSAPLGIYSAGLRSRDIAFPIIYAGIQSAIKNPSKFGHRDIIFIDEAHLVNQEESSMYQTFLATMKLINPCVKIIGMTATPFRMGQGMITDGDQAIFTDIIHNLSDINGFNSLLTDGYLSPLIPLRTHTELDVSEVGMRNHEFIPGQLQGAVDKQEITHAGLKELVHAGSNRRSWLIFSSGIEHAEHIAAMLTSFGVDCAAIHSKQKPEYNDAAIKAFKSNRLRSIVNFSKLTTGFNHPDIDLIGDFRPTMSIPLHVQKLGRGTRPAPGKNNCIAEGSLVLTNQGLIPIEKITINMKVWDGINFVCHEGIIDKGIQNVIEYAGLIATPEHKVWTKSGWQTLQRCSEKYISIASTAIGGQAIYEIENYFITNTLQRRHDPQTLYFNRMSGLFIKKFKRILERQAFKSWLSSVRQQSYLASASEMASISMYNGERQMLQYTQQTIFRLWWSRYSISFQKSNLYGYMDYAKSWITQTFTYRSNKKRWSLRSWKSAVCDASRKYVKSQNNKSNRTKVYDIINAGPYRRFTVNGLLVSNCLVLDFSRNVPRLGPINDPIIPRKKGEKVGDPPVKICESCGAYNHASVRICCQCGAEFTFKIKIVAKPGHEEIIKSDLPVIESFDVKRVTYLPHQKTGSPPCMRICYYTGLQMFQEFIMFEHGGSPAKRAREWWRQVASWAVYDTPKTTQEALQYTSQLRPPRKIRVWCNKQYPEILSREF